MWLKEEIDKNHQPAKKNNYECKAERTADNRKERYLNTFEEKCK